MRISTSESIARIPILEVRRLLRAVVDSLSIGAVSRVLAISERQAKALVKELELREMLKRDGDRWGITVKGGALALASAAKPLTRQTAERLVNGLYTRTVEVNRNPRFLFQVREVRLFGSYLSNASQLGDVDVALDVASKLPHDGHRVERYMSHCREAERSGRQFKTYFDRLGWPEREVWLFLKSRSRGLSLHSLSDLESLSAPSDRLYPRDS